MSRLHDLVEIGESIWLDYIRRDMLDSGRLNQLHRTGVRGVTSNPSIFDKAIADSDDYDDAFRVLAAEGKSPQAIYEALAVEDIQRACDVFADLYRQSEGEDGYVSLEVNPNLAYKTEETIEEARRLFAAVDRPNVYIKVPGTPEGVPAIRKLISEGINVNVTLLFSLSAYEAIAEAYIAGLEDLAANGGDVSQVTSVASFFVSRVDGKVDKALDELGNSEVRGKIGIANAKLAYQRFLEIFSGPRWEELAQQGAKVQRPLYGSTSTKDPAYPDTLYVDGLIGPYVINTIPPHTLEAFLDHGTVARTVDKDVDEAREQMEKLAELGIDIDEVTDELLEEGVDKFAASFNSLMDTIEKRRERLLAEGARREQWEESLGTLEQTAQSAAQDVRDDKVLERLWQKDYTLWSDEPDEITNRLDWLHVATEMQEEIPCIDDLVETLRGEGYLKAILLGMGGSSLAPELFARTFGPVPGYLELEVLDSTDPQAVSAARSGMDPQKTVFIVSSKSGTTVETLSFFKYFYNWMLDAVGEEEVGDHFIAITDEGSNLAGMAQELDFRALFLNNPNLGGRYSALSHFGLVPAALVGVDLQRLLECPAEVSGPQDVAAAARLGAILGALANEGYDKLTLITSDEIASFGDWVEQLIAESTGKDGKGILPIVGEAPASPDVYGDDRLFVYMRLKGGTNYDSQVAEIDEAGFPLLTVHLDDPYDLGEQFLHWEIATAVAGHVMGIHPFNQPNVESAKKRAKQRIEEYKSQGSLPDPGTVIAGGGVSVYEISTAADTPVEALHRFLENARSEGYVAIHAYVPPTPENHALLSNFRIHLRRMTGLAVTVGYGPRFLHSTGQLHKGDAGNGIFVQLLTEPMQDVPIPDEPGSSESTLGFGVLKVAQAMGDAQALQDAGRRVVRFQTGGDVRRMLVELMRQ